MNATSDQVKAAIETIRAIADTIRSLGSIPSGELYARVMQYIPIDSYNRIIDILVNSGLITKTNNLLTWKVL
jgi:hypothetical protein